jgi:integrase
MIYKRGSTWWIGFKKRIKENGKSKLIWIYQKSAKTKNRELAQKIERKIAITLTENKWFDVIQEQTIYFNEVWEKYLNEVIKYHSPGSYSRATYFGKVILPAIGNLTLNQITPAVLSTYKAKRLEDGLKPMSVAREMDHIRRVFSLCKKEWQLVKQNPFEYFVMPKANGQRIKFLEPGQFEILLRVCPEWLKPIITLAKYTGMRRGNIINLKWSEVDLQNRVINLDRTKNGERLSIPLSDTPYRVLKSIMVYMRCPYVFHDKGEPYTSNRVRLAFERVRERAGMSDFRFHDLRHEFASQLVKSGVDLYRVQRLLGHKDSRMTQRYTHLAVEDLRKAVENQEVSIQMSIQ